MVSTTGTPLSVSQRVTYNNTFNEVFAMPDTKLSTTYYFPWYDQYSAGMTDWLMIGNTGATTAAVDVYFGTYRVGTYYISPNSAIAPTYAGWYGGPIKVVPTPGTTAQNIVASQRVLYNGKFNETMGIPAQQTSTVYTFPWYDGTNGMSDWIMVGNVSTYIATATIYFGTYAAASANIAPSSYWTPSFPGWSGGPITVVSNQKIIASQRVLYNGSFNEVMGTSLLQTSTAYYFPWYDNNSSWGMNGDWLMVGNPSSTQTASVNVKIGPYSYSYSIGPWQVKSVVAPANTTTGPVKVTSNIPIYASQRVIYYSSFNETTGMPLQ